jgi:hypothetical protein
MILDIFRNKLSNYVHTPIGKIVISVLFGIGLASLFKDDCRGKHCAVKIGPTLDELKQTYKLDGKCYKVVTEPVTCGAKMGGVGDFDRTVVKIDNIEPFALQKGTARA